MVKTRKTIDIITEMEQNITDPEIMIACLSEIKEKLEIVE